jgi:hypothetical protein
MKKIKKLITPENIKLAVSVVKLIHAINDLFM